MSRQKISSVTAEAPDLLAIVWRNGKETKVNISQFLDCPGYESLNEPAIFASAVVEESGHGVEWTEGAIGIDANSLYRIGKEQTGVAFPVNEFNAWMNRNGLSLSGAAKALGITRRTVVYYHGGHKPIPIYIKLACLGWEVLHARQAA